MLSPNASFLVARASFTQSDRRILGSLPHHMPNAAGIFMLIIFCKNKDSTSLQHKQNIKYRVCTLQAPSPTAAGTSP